MTIKHTIFVVTLSVSSFVSLSQNKIDSLKSLLNSNVEDTQKVNTLYAIAFEYADMDDELAIKYGVEGFSLAKKLSDTLGMVKTGKITAYAFRKLNKIDSAIILGTQIIPMSEKKNYTSESIKIINGLALAYSFKGQYDWALRYYFRNLELVRITKDTIYEAAALNNLGYVYFKLKNFDKSLSYYQECLGLRMKMNDSLSMDRLLINIGNCYAGKRNFKEAEKYVLDGLSICRNDCSSQTMVEGYYALGYIFSESQDFRKAEKYIILSYDMAQKTNYVRLIFDNVDLLTEHYFKQGRIKEAKKYLDECEIIARGNGLQYTREATKFYLRFSELYERTGDYKKSSFYQRKYSELRDSVHNETSTTSLMKIEADYIEKENQAKIDSQNQVLLLKEEIIKRQNLLNIAISLIVVILIVLIIILFKINRQRKTINQFLESKVKERTRELENNQNELIKACSERDLLIEKTAQTVRSSLASIKGICEVGLKDVSESGARVYIQKVGETSDSLSNSLNALLHIQKRTAVKSI